MEDKSDRLSRKPSIRKKPPPPVRETLTSKYRLLKADPLLAKELGIKDLNKLNTKEMKNNNLLDCKLKSFANQFAEKSTTQPVPSASHDKRPNNEKLKIQNNSNIFQHSRQFLSSTKLTDKTRKIDFIKQNIEQASIKTIKNGKNQQQPSKNLIKSKPIIGRSLSAQHFDKKNGKQQQQQQQQRLERDEKRLSRSFEEVSKTTTTKNDLTFRTPLAYQRRSVIIKTPSTLANHGKIVPFTSTPTPYNLQKRLIVWLEKHGKTFHDFQHLKCFGNDLNQLKDEANKENVEIADDTSYEQLHIIPPTVDEENIVKNLLVDLQNLLLDGYPNDQCEMWLRLIQQKYENLQKQPDYWEIRALIEQSHGNLTSAVECYQTAIIQGAEIRNVDESLENLLHKFSLLNITPQTFNNNMNNKERQRIIRDARNVFKSSIIQFAVKERKLKNANCDNDGGKRFIATPVRRSTRTSRGKYTLTPGVKIYSSLKEVDSPIRNNFDFKSNVAL